jgi:glycine cleavage system H protein
LTDHGQETLGEIIHVELPPVGKRLAKGEEAAAVESSKASVGLDVPVSGAIVTVNEALADAPGLVNSDPYGKGWLYEMSLSDADELASLMDAHRYQEYLRQDAT